jgi:hypothetical protein
MFKFRPLATLRLWMVHRHDRMVLAQFDDRTRRTIGLPRSSAGYSAKHIMS